jgi:hypothetical protein
LAKLNPGILNVARAQDIVRRFLRVRPTIEGNLDAWEFLKGLKTVFVDTEKRERNVQLLDPVNGGAKHSGRELDGNVGGKGNRAIMARASCHGPPERRFLPRHVATG